MLVRAAAVALLWALVCLGLSQVLAARLAQVPGLSFDTVRVLAPFHIELLHPRQSLGRLQVSAERVRLGWRSLLGHSLCLRQGMVQVRYPDAEPSARVELALGDVCVTGSWLPPFERHVFSEHGELELELQGKSASFQELELAGTLGASPALFGRLPLLAEAARELGPAFSGMRKLPVRVHGSLFSPAIETGPAAH